MKPFRLNVELRKDCFLLPILFLICMDKIVKKSEPRGRVKIGDCTAQHLLFADDLVLLQSTQNDLQQALHRFSAGIKIIATKTETMRLSRQPKQCSLKVGKVPLKSTSASHSQVMANKIANWISASEKQVQ